MRNRATTPLSKAKVRQSWSKYNLYNLSRFRNPPNATRTFFQQKFAAKSIARAYHGEQVRESQWQRMFSRRLRSVVPMNTSQLARDDGSQISAGRGSGLDVSPIGSPFSSVPRTPYTQMTFAPLERRLDVAVFRALFASSTRQARQFVVHGAVTVNGKKMRYPGYLLNPGDLFQVDPEQVMYATGAPKDKQERREARVAKKKAAEPEQSEDAEASAEENKEKKESKEGEENEEGEDQDQDPRETLKALLSQAKNIMTDSKDVVPAKRKQELRGFQKAVRRVLSRSEASSVLQGSLESQFSELISLLKAKKVEKGDEEGRKNAPRERRSEKKDQTEPAAAETSTQPGEKLTEAFRAAAENPGEDLDIKLTSELSDEEFDVLKRALIQMRDNPIDATKPYATPWRPRDYMSAFAFIPRYLEVNQNICAAVYLRHPVARPGFSEVPTPFGEAIGTAAYAWYLRRR